jgi:hypothetical protein
MNCFSIIISITVSLITFLSYFSIITIILQRVTTRSSDLFQYKLKSKSLSIVFATIYVLLFICLLYGLRIYNIHRTLDLKEVYQSFKDISSLFTVMDLYLLFLLLLFILSLLLLLLTIIHNFFIHHIFMLYLYYTCSPDYARARIESQFNLRKVSVRTYYLHKFQTKLYQLLFDIGHTDIILFSFYRFSYFITKIINGGPVSDYNTLSKYNPYCFLGMVVYSQRYRNIYNLFITLSPFLVIIYDCIFNNWVLYYVYYYLLFYIPIILLKRVTIFIRLDPSYILDIIWDIYYKEKKNCIFAISKKDSIIITSYLFSGLRVTPDHIDLQLSNIPFYLYNCISFERCNEERNTYMNNEGIYLHMTKDNRVFLEIEVVEYKEDDYEIRYTLGEEWILLATK